jgi:hypothetical protein
LDYLKKNVYTVIVGMHASKPPKMSFQVAGYEEIQDGHRINEDYRIRRVTLYVRRMLMGQWGCE